MKFSLLNIIKSEFFEVEKINCNNIFEDVSNSTTFFAINVVEGEGSIETINKEYKIKKGDSFLIPAFLGKYKIEGNITFLKSYII